MPIDNAIYDRLADGWWNEAGMLHALRTSMNPARVGYVRRILVDRLGIDPSRCAVLDVGCGGGFLAEEFARLGARVVGVDPSAASLDAARRHAASERLDITYRLGRGEDLPCDDASFDVVLCCDVLEHVDLVGAVVHEIARVLRPGGVFFFDTINRTAASRLVVIKLMQEWRWSSWVPRDLHDWDRFITPDELRADLAAAGLAQRHLIGLVPGVGPLAMVRAIRARKRGAITFGEFGRRVPIVEGRSTAIGYMGYATKATRPFGTRLTTESTPCAASADC
jgi:2-polyprenyl-6-hydroxyphenyl methylase/3-demethylubiquinone-9 3-methyltransferase